MSRVMKIATRPRISFARSLRPKQNRYVCIRRTQVYTYMFLSMYVRVCDEKCIREKYR